MKKQKARGQVRRFLRRSIACLLAIVGMGMAAVTAGLPQPLGWLGGLGGIQTAMAAQAPAGDGPVPFWQRLLLGDSALLAQWAAESAGQAQGEKPEETAPEEAEEEQNLQAVTPDKIQENHLRQRLWLCQCPGHLPVQPDREDGGSGGGGQGRVFPLLSKGGGRPPSPDYAYPWNGILCPGRHRALHRDRGGPDHGHLL